MTAAKPRLCVDCAHNEKLHYHHGPVYKCHRVPDVPAQEYVDVVSGQTRWFGHVNNTTSCETEREPLSITDYVLKRRCGPEGRFFVAKDSS